MRPTTIPQPIERPYWTDHDLVEEMTGMIASHDEWSTAQALAALRRRYPDSPLATRLAALAVLMKRPGKPNKPLTDKPSAGA